MYSPEFTCDDLCTGQNCSSVPEDFINLYKSQSDQCMMRISDRREVYFVLIFGSIGDLVKDSQVYWRRAEKCCQLFANKQQTKLLG